MQPPKPVYEKVRTDDFVTAVLDDYTYDAEHIFKGPKGERTGPAIRFNFTIEGMKFPKRSQWMSFSYHEKSGLYSKYLVSLVEGARPNMTFDIDQLKGLRVKMLWKENPKNPDYQLIDTIRPIDKKVLPVFTGTDTVPVADTVPF